MSKKSPKANEIQHGGIAFAKNGQLVPRDGKPLAKVSSKSTHHIVATAYKSVMVAHYWVRVAPFIAILPILYFMGVVSGLGAELLTIMSVAGLLISGGFTIVGIAEGHLSAGLNYRQEVAEILDEVSEHGVRNPEKANLYGGSAAKGELIMEPKLRYSLSPMRFVKPRVIGQSHYYDPEKGVHEVVTASNSVYGTKVTSEKYLTDLAIFNRALDRMESL